MKIAKQDFLKKSLETLSGLYDTLKDLPDVSLEDLQPDQTVLVMVDMINGFTREGMLKSPRVEAVIPGIAGLSAACGVKGIPSIAFADTHTDASPEFTAYPPHCLEGSSEAELVDELKAIGGYTLMGKNSTNGFLEEVFQKWLADHPQTDTFVVVGDCTDICIQQFAVTLKTWFNRQNKSSRIIVPADLAETYDLGLHDGDLMHVTALYSMMGNGIEVVGNIKLK